MIEGFATTVVPWGTDVPFLRGIGRPLLLGPGSIHDAHKPDEKVHTQQLRDAVECYCTLIRRLS